MKKENGNKIESFNLIARGLWSVDNTDKIEQFRHHWHLAVWIIINTDQNGDNWTKWTKLTIRTKGKGTQN